MHLNRQELKNILKNLTLDPSTTIEKISAINGIQQTKMVWKVGGENYLHHTAD